MEFENVAIPAETHRTGRGKYAEMWKALAATKGETAIAIKGLTVEEAQAIRAASRLYARKGSEFKVASVFRDGVMTLWLVRRVIGTPVVGRTLSAIR